MTTPLDRAPWRAPDTFLILLGVALAAFAATYVAPHGVFDVITAEGARPRLDPETFRVVEDVGGAPLFGSEERTGLASFVFEGLVSGGRQSATVGLAAFLLIIGGAFGMIMRSGAVDRALTAALGRRASPNPVLIAGLFAAFSLGGAVFGLSEEAIVLSLIVVPALVRAGYDAITGLLVVYVASQIGFATSWMNPFSVLVAQGVAGVAPMSGLELRVVMWTVFTALGAAFTVAHAERVRRDPSRSLSAAADASFRAEAAPTGEGAARFGAGDAAVLAVVVLGTVWVAWGVIAQGYYLAEIAAQFFVVGAVAAVVARVFRLGGVDGNDLMEAFRDGAMRMVPAVLVVGAAKGVVALLGGDDPTAPSLFNTLLHAAAGWTSALPDQASAIGMLFVQSGINFLVVSGSGQAALTMPIMAPLGDLVGVSRQTAVLAFQLGDGLTNIIVPASAALMGCLTAARIDWVTWVRFMWRPMLALMGLAAGFVALAQAIGYS